MELHNIRLFLASISLQSSDGHDVACQPYSREFLSLMSEITTTAAGQKTSLPIPDGRPAAATLDDVAKLAKVSPITVSRVINRPELVSEKTTKRVRNAIRKTGYVPNLLAGGLVSQRSRLVIVVIPNIANRAFVDTVSQLGQRLAASRYQLLVSQADLNAASEADLVDNILARRPDGIVLTRQLFTQEAREKLLGRGTPIVEAWELHEDPIDTVVGFSHEAVGRMMAEHMIERGYRRIALIWSDDARGTRRRLACVQRLAEAGLEPVAVELQSVPVAVGNGRQAMAKLLARKVGMDAVICSIDLLAQGVIAEATASGLRIPQDVAVMGFGDLEFAAHTHPRLTTVGIDGGRIGLRTAELLLERIDGRLAARACVEDVGFSLVVREST
ncbi:LacI family DNA-binding transcriptional regulator [Pseudomonas sp. PA1(2017)]|uniref:LacI family DNA-binding transcriptional regulator n=1 Tax=Pseudomonas sp. PA1(2017) TaxID=1932113 RepID=UPI000A561473|nr:LacI family DNA-binding transcriptional regulator [Pseudomonas sp. PA1(2017)]